MKVLRTFFVILCFTTATFIGTALALANKIPEGYRDIKLGMNKAQVLELLKKGPIHSTFDDLGNDIGEIIRGDDLFRFATYRFDQEDILVEIDLEMREILGKDRVLDLYNKQLGLSISPLKATVESNKSIEVRDNLVVIKMEPGKDTRSAQAKNAKP